MRIDYGSLTYSGVSFQFGAGTPFHILGFDPGAAGWAVGDQANPLSDGIRFGRDRKQDALYELRLAVQGQGPDETKSLVAQFRQAWDAADLRGRSGEMAAFSIAGSRHAYGRPRSVEIDVSLLSVSSVLMRAQFVAANDLWYGPAQTTTIRLVPEFTGGLPVPAAVPFVLGGGTGVSDFMVTVGGDVATRPVFEVHGPILDPFIEVAGVGRLIFKGQLAYDQTLTVDTRQWAQWVKRNGASFPGALSPTGARLSDMSLLPGSYQVFFGGYDPSGTSSLDVIVEPAFTSF